MSHPDFTRSFTAAILLSLQFALPALAGADLKEYPTAEPCPLKVAVCGGETVGWEQIRRVLINAGTNEFVFVAPQGLRIQTEQTKVEVTPTAFSFFLTFRILTNAAGLDLEDLNAARALTLNRFPEARCVEENPKSVAGKTGSALNLRYNKGGVEHVICVALIPSAAGVLEFTLFAPQEKSPEARNAFNMILRTFRSNEGSKLEISARVVEQT